MSEMHLQVCSYIVISVSHFIFVLKWYVLFLKPKKAADVSVYMKEETKRKHCHSRDMLSFKT
jgi:hypothetical protein